MLIPIDPENPPGIVGKTALLAGVFGAMFLVYLGAHWLIDNYGAWTAIPWVGLMLLLAFWLERHPIRYKR